MPRLQLHRIDLRALLTRLIDELAHETLRHSHVSLRDQVRDLPVLDVDAGLGCRRHDGAERRRLERGEDRGVGHVWHPGLVEVRWVDEVLLG